MKYSVHVGIGIERRSTGFVPAWRVQTSPKCVQNVSYCVHACLASVQKYSGDFGKSWTRHDGQTTDNLWCGRKRTNLETVWTPLSGQGRMHLYMSWHLSRTHWTQFGQLMMDATGHCLDGVWTHLDESRLGVRGAFGPIGQFGQFMMDATGHCMDSVWTLLDEYHLGRLLDSFRTGEYGRKMTGTGLIRMYLDASWILDSFQTVFTCMNGQVLDTFQTRGQNGHNLDNNFVQTVSTHVRTRPKLVQSFYLKLCLYESVHNYVQYCTHPVIVNCRIVVWGTIQKVHTPSEGKGRRGMETNAKVNADADTCGGEGVGQSLG